MDADLEALLDDALGDFKDPDIKAAVGGSTTTPRWAPHFLFQAA